MRLKPIQPIKSSENIDLIRCDPIHGRIQSVVTSESTIRFIVGDLMSNGAIFCGDFVKRYQYWNAGEPGGNPSTGNDSVGVRGYYPRKMLRLCMQNSAF